MYLNYAKIKNGQKKQPMLRLRTLAGKELGVVPFVYDLKFCINYSEVSTIEFTTPYMVNGMINPLYAALSSYKVLYTEEFGIYVLTSPSKTGDGVKECKEVKGYSLEQMFQTKSLFLEEGTYAFWNPVDSKDTILGRIIELDPSWHVGYVAPRLLGCYRTFDQYDSDALSFCYGDAMEKYRCAFVFDVYEKRINVYDATEDVGTLPIYLSYNNLLESVTVEELTDDIATKVHLSGSDGLTIRDVNPTGTDYIVNLDYFLYNGDLDIKVGGSSKTLADRVREWQLAIAAKQTYYTGLVSVRASLTAQKLAAEAELTELKGQLDDLTNQQSVTIQAIAMETTNSGKTTQQNKLNQINAKITSKNAEINAQKAKIDSLKADVDKYMSTLSAINKELSFEGYFTKSEQEILNSFMIEANLSDETFVVTDVDTKSSGVVSTVSGNVSVEGADITRVSLPSFGKTMYVVAGGTMKIPNVKISAESMRGTLEVTGSNYVLTAYLGKTSYNGHDFSTGLITIAGSLSQLTTDVASQSQNGVTEYKGTRLSFQTSGADSYFTVSANDYQKYSVAMELYDFGTEVLDDYAWPVYEFSVDSANFLYHEKFEPFKNSLELGKAIHLRLGSEGLISAKVIGVELDFEDIGNFNLIFSNRYQRKNGLEKMQDEIRNMSRSSRTLNVSKYIYNRTTDRVTAVSELMKQQLVAAVQNIVNKEDQTVIINSSGINVGGSSKYQLRIVDNMIAMTDDGWKTAKLAIGLFATKDMGTHWGVNAEVIAGKLLVGSNLYIETQDGCFIVDNTGVHIDAMKFYINNGKNLSDTLDDIDTSISNVSGSVTKLRSDFDSVTTKTSSGITLDANDIKGVISAQQAQMKSAGGNVLFDSDGMWLLNGTTKANSTKAIWMNENGILFGSGSRTSNPGKNWTNWTTAIGHNGIVADNIAAGTLNGMKISGGEITIGKNSSSDNTYFHVDSYGNLGIGRNTSKAKGYNFYVDYNGKMYAYSGEFGGALKAATGTFSGALQAATGTFSGSLSAVNGTFTGTLSAAKISGTLTANSGAEIIGPAIYVPDKYYPKFKVDSYGNVTMTGNLTLGNGVISWSNLAWGVQNDINSASQAASSAWNKADQAFNLAAQNQVPYYITSTKITQTTIESPTITGNVMVSSSFSLSNNAGEITIGYGATDVGGTQGIKMGSTYGSYYFIATNAGVRMQAGGTNLYCSDNGIGASSEISVTSDKRVKNSIRYDMDKYEDFFHALKPCSFRYNHEKSRKFHVGYIAQDVKSAMDRSGLTSSDFAGYVSGVRTGLTKYDDELALGYSEFIALNTHMIKKLYKRIEQLELKVQSLEG